MLLNCGGSGGSAVAAIARAATRSDNNGLPTTALPPEAGAGRFRFRYGTPGRLRGGRAAAPGGAPGESAPC